MVRLTGRWINQTCVLSRHTALLEFGHDGIIRYYPVDKVNDLILS